MNRGSAMRAVLLTSGPAAAECPQPGNNWAPAARSPVPAKASAGRSMDNPCPHRYLTRTGERWTCKECGAVLTVEEAVVGYVEGWDDYVDPKEAK